MLPQIELMMKSACPELVDRDDDSIRNLLKQIDDWDELSALVYRHGIAYPVATTLSAFDDLVPASFLQELNGHAQASFEFNQSLITTQFELLPKFETRDIRAMPIKGLEMQAVCAPLQMRPYSDIDIFIEARKARAAVDLLLELGYSLKSGGEWNESEFRWSHGETFKSPDYGHEIDLHWDILSVRAFGCRFPFMDLWERRREVTLRDRDIQVASREDLFLILCVHGCKHSWSLLKWARDVALLCTDEDLDWELLRRRARNHGRSTHGADQPESHRGLFSIRSTAGGYTCFSCWSKGPFVGCRASRSHRSRL